MGLLYQAYASSFALVYSFCTRHWLRSCFLWFQVYFILCEF